MELSEVLEKYRNLFHWLFGPPFKPDTGLKIYLGKGNPELLSLDLSTMIELDHYLTERLERSGKNFAYGGYGENREFYARSELFTGGKRRTIHLGVDFWLPAGTPVYLPFEGRISSAADNLGKGNYGPTIITEHILEGRTFHMLFGHLSRQSLPTADKGSKRRIGDPIGFLGDFDENGNWPPHLHFQIIEKLNNQIGDYPGVAAPDEAPAYLENSPDPLLIFNLT